MTLHPNEFAVDLTYALKLNDNLSIGATGRYMRSDLTNSISFDDGGGWTPTHAANSLAADIGLYYQQNVDKAQDYALGVFISNLGAKLSYSDEDNDKEFLPANLRIGGRYTNRIDDYNKISVLLDFNKLLVPTPPLRRDMSSATTEEQKKYEEEWSRYNSMGVIEGAFNSFTDAPGGFSEELKEIQWSIGAEYVYHDQFSLRAGYHHQAESKGNLKYFTVGGGFRMSVFSLDVGYVISTARSNPLDQTLRFTLAFDMDGIKDLFRR